MKEALCKYVQLALEVRRNDSASEILHKRLDFPYRQNISLYGYPFSIRQYDVHIYKHNASILCAHLKNENAYIQRNQRLQIRIIDNSVDIDFITSTKLSSPTKKQYGSM